MSGVRARAISIAVLTACLAAGSAVAGASPVDSAADAPVGSATSFGSSAGDASADGYLVQFSSRLGLSRGRADLEDEGFATKAVSSSGINVVKVDAHSSDLQTLRALPGVVAVEAIQTYTTATDQTDPPWGLDRIDQRALPIDSSYNPSATGAGVTAYVIDSGLWLTHTEFTERVPYSAYWDFGDGTQSWDCNGHGTHVAGTVGGTTYGVAKGVSIVPVKVLDCNGSAPTDAVIAGINWVIGDHTAGTPAVANLSLGGAASSILDAAIEALVADGVTVVVAAGNSSAPTCNYSPARVPAAITVAASEIDDDDADYSNYGSCNDLFAPGSNILSAWIDGNAAFNTISGTSMASPHVAGAAALLLQGTPAATPAQVWASIDAAATLGALSECCGDPDKLLFVQTAVEPSTTTTSTTTTTSPTTTTSTTTTTSPPPDPSPPDPAFVPMTPARLMDSRPGKDTADNLYEGIGLRSPNSVTAMDVTGRLDVPANALAVVLNVTVTGVIGSGFLTVFPCGEDVPTASNLNFVIGSTVPNAVVVKVGDAGQVCFYTSASATMHLIVDINGYYPADSSFVPMTPARLMDSRPGKDTADNLYEGIGLRSPDSVTSVDVTGRLDVPADAQAVALNVTVTGVTGPGFLTVFPCGEDVPTASNLNFVIGSTVPNAVIVKVGDNGQVCFYASPTATMHLIIDINGYYPAGSDFAPLTPARLMDSRPGRLTTDHLYEGIGLRSADSATSMDVTGRVDVPADAMAVVLNVTVTGVVAPGFLTVFPCGEDVPNASNLNFVVGSTVPNAVIVKVGDNGQVCFYTSQTATMHLIVDINGYYPAVA